MAGRFVLCVGCFCCESHISPRGQCKVYLNVSVIQLIIFQQLFYFFHHFRLKHALYDVFLCRLDSTTKAYKTMNRL